MSNTTAALIKAAELYTYRRECFADSNEGMCAFHLFQDVIARLASMERYERRTGNYSGAQEFRPERIEQQAVHATAAEEIEWHRKHSFELGFEACESTYKGVVDAARETIEDNLHLADGNNCTLYKLKTALAAIEQQNAVIEVGIVDEITQRFLNNAHEVKDNPVAAQYRADVGFLLTEISKIVRSATETAKSYISLANAIIEEKE